MPQPRQRLSTEKLPANGGGTLLLVTGEGQALGELLQATLTAQHCLPQQCLQFRAVDMGQPRSQGANKSARNGQVRSDVEENQCQYHLSNAQHTFLLFITQGNGHSLKGWWGKVQPFPKCQCAEQLLQNTLQSCVFVCVRAFLGRVGTRAAANVPSTPVTAPGPTLLPSHQQ